MNACITCDVCMITHIWQLLTMLMEQLDGLLFSDNPVPVVERKQNFCVFNFIVIAVMLFEYYSTLLSAKHTLYVELHVWVYEVNLDALPYQKAWLIDKRPV